MVLGSNATGPGSERLLAALGEHEARACCSATAGDGEPYVLPHRIDHGANLRALLGGGLRPRARRSARSAR